MYTELTDEQLACFEAWKQLPIHFKIYLSDSVSRLQYLQDSESGYLAHFPLVRGSNILSKTHRGGKSWWYTEKINNPSRFIHYNSRNIKNNKYFDAKQIGIPLTTEDLFYAGNHALLEWEKVYDELNIKSPKLFLIERKDDYLSQVNEIIRVYNKIYLKKMFSVSDILKHDFSSFGGLSISDFKFTGDQILVNNCAGWGKLFMSGLLDLMFNIKSGLEIDFRPYTFKFKATYREDILQELLYANIQIEFYEGFFDLIYKNPEYTG